MVYQNFHGYKWNVFYVGVFLFGSLPIGWLGWRKWARISIGCLFYGYFAPTNRKVPKYEKTYVKSRFIYIRENFDYNEQKHLFTIFMRKNTTTNGFYVEICTSSIHFLFILIIRTCLFLCARYILLPLIVIHNDGKSNFSRVEMKRLFYETVDLSGWLG